MAPCAEAAANLHAISVSAWATSTALSARTCVVSREYFVVSKREIVMTE